MEKEVQLGRFDPSSGLRDQCLLPGEWVQLRSPGVGAMVKDARLGAGKLCREQTWLDSSMGYPGQGEETLRCHRLSPGRAGGPGAWNKSKLGTSTS